MSQSTHVAVDRDDGGACDCGGHYWWRKYCGAYVCDKCDDHKGLARCFCGWNHHSGEKLEGEECDYFGDEPLDDEGFGYRE